MHRLLIAAGIALGLVAFWASDASADAGGHIATDHAGADVTASRSDRAPAADGSGGGADECEYRRLPIDASRTVFAPDGSRVEVNGEGAWFEKWCGSQFFGAFWVSAVDPAELVDEARRRLDLPLPVAAFSPAGAQYVNLETWLWLVGGWEPREATAAVPGVAVTVRAVPVAAVWVMGDGAVRECGPGTPFDSSGSAAEGASCAHTYRRPSGEPGGLFAGSVTVRWRLSWSVTGAAGGGELGSVDRTSGFGVLVSEVQVLNVVPGGSR